jgi:hypothetical protein
MMRPLPARLAHVLALALACVAAGPGCSKPAPPADAGAPAALAPVPVPAGLLADLYLTTPDATWSKARATIGGPAMLMPASAGALVATLVGLPITAAPEVDGAVPILGALGEAAEQPQIAIAVHVRDGGRFVDQLTKPAEARFSARAEGADEIVHLEPKGAGPKPPAVLAVIGNYLVLAPTAAELVALGPYVARTLPTRAAPKDELAIEADGAALAGPVTKAARALTAEAARLPLGGAVQSVLDVLGDAKHARLVANLDERGLHARAVVTPKSGGAAEKLLAAVAVGDPKRMLDLPADSLAAFVFYQTAAARAEGAAVQAEALGRLLSKPLSAAEKETVTATLAALGEARGDWFYGGVTVGPTGPAGFARAAVTDADRLGKGVKSLLGLVKGGPVKALLDDMELGVSTGSAKVDGVAGSVERFRLERRSKDKKAADGPSAIDLLYAIDKESMLVATGFDAKSALASLAAAPKKENLGGVPEAKAAVEGLGPEVAFAVMFDPLRIGVAQGGKAPTAAGPIALAAGKGGSGAASELWARVDVATEALREVARRRVGGR